MYGPRLAAVWDLFYGQGRGKDYAAEARELAEVVRELVPGARSVLDVGCGTGEHAAMLREWFEHVEGLDASAAMLDVARTKLPARLLHLGDMRTFRLGRRYDAVVCLNTGVAYLPSLDDLAAALRRMAAHLEPGGVLVIEPWWFPDRYLDGYVAADVVRADGRSVARTSHTRAAGGSARMDIHYLVADADGIEHFTEEHVFGLWSREGYLAAFAAAGCSAAYRPTTLSGYGMFVARRGVALGGAATDEMTSASPGRDS